MVPVDNLNADDPPIVPAEETTASYPDQPQQQQSSNEDDNDRSTMGKMSPQLDANFQELIRRRAISEEASPSTQALALETAIMVESQLSHMKNSIAELEDLLGQPHHSAAVVQDDESSSCTTSRGDDGEEQEESDEVADSVLENDKE